MQTSLDQQVKDLSSQLDEEVSKISKTAKREASKLQARVSEFVLRYNADLYPV